jgi:4-amino-4-deoxy-L-arabinose transferase-like glycosyltransferase
VLLSGDQIYLEHALLSESLFTALVAAAAYAGVRATGRGRAAGWLTACGALLAAAALTRGVGLALVPVAVAWATLTARGAPGPGRLVAGGAVLLAATVPLVGYVAVTAMRGGDTGLVEQAGWSLYARAAPFARCSEFVPPPGTAGLCEGSSPEGRPGGSFYLWDRHRSPARRAFGFPPARSELAGAFARGAIMAQPLDYLREVGGESVRVVRPDAPARPLSGGGSTTLAIDRRSYGFESEITDAATRAGYSHAPVTVSPEIRALAAYQHVTGVVSGALIVTIGTILLVGAAAGRRGGSSPGASLLAGLALALLFAPIAAFQYTPRFAVPVLGLWSAAGAAVLTSLGSRLAPSGIGRRRAAAMALDARSRTARTP